MKRAMIFFYKQYLNKKKFFSKRIYIYIYNSVITSCETIRNNYSIKLKQLFLNFKIFILPSNSVLYI